MYATNTASVPVSIPLGFQGNGNGSFLGANGIGDLAALIIVAGLFGWGGYGNGGWGGYGSGGIQENYILNSDFSQLSKQISDTYNMTDRKFEGLANGLCSMGYETQGLINGVNNNIMQGTNALSTQIGDVKYAIGAVGSDIGRTIDFNANNLDRRVSDGFCQTNFNNQTNTRDIIDVHRSDTQAIMQKLDAMETNRLREKLEAERDARYALQGQLDRAQLRTDIVNDIHPCPKPAYLSCNPWGCNCQQNVYGTTIA